MPNRVEISVVIPVYNSEDILSELVRQIDNVLTKYKYEIIFVNDGSLDNSWQTIEKITTKSKSVIAICLSKNFGQDNAIMAGLGLSKGDYAVIMDDDLQHSPYDITALLDRVKEGYDVCYANYSWHRKQSILKNIGSIVNAKQAEYFIGKPSKIYLSPFKIISRIVIDSIVDYIGPYPYVDGLIFQVTDSISQVTVQHHQRYKGHGNYNIKKSLSVFLKHTTGFSVTPLRLASLVGLLIAAVGFLTGLFYIAQYLYSDTVLEGWTTLVVLQLFIGGLIIMFLGFIGEYLGRAYLSINHKPQFVIKKILS
ncbi:glycosyltransferase family 2 protein [Candidatus Woesearchaeota archaeon]|nr:glycosyltransferase family 2 protein [Candidatus Woesearchaeota archaeon]MBT4764960.1 glycosyltransferase family 2 protein [bacterium]